MSIPRHCSRAAAYLGTHGNGHSIGELVDTGEGQRTGLQAKLEVLGSIAAARLLDQTGIRLTSNRGKAEHGAEEGGRGETGVRCEV